jgi:NAD(P)-dependent dehydrogenase (short-subunit alcohol dehydrogenase family)
VSRCAEKVILISSLMGSIADNDYSGHFGYRAANAALNMIGRGLAADLRQFEISVGMIHPGMVFTNFDGGKTRRPGHHDVEASVEGVVQAIKQVSCETCGCFLHGNYGQGVKPLSW